MTETIKVGLIQQANTADIENNRQRLGEKIRRLAADGAQLIVNQELHDSLYFCQTENVDLVAAAAAPAKITAVSAAAITAVYLPVSSGLTVKVKNVCACPPLRTRVMIASPMDLAVITPF